MQGLLDALASPPMRHAMIVHAPIGLAFASLVVALFAALLSRMRGLRVATLVLLGLLALGAWQAKQSGEAARDALPGPLPEESYLLVSEHEELGERLPLIAVAGALVAALALAKRAPLALVGSWGAVLASALACGWVLWTAHHGGRLVYEHGLGTPPPGRAEARVGAPSDPRLEFFEDRVAPLLAARCQSCHNPARAERSGRLDQTTMRGLLEGGDSGPALVPGDPDASLLLQRVRSDDPTWIMPPSDEGDALTQEEIAILERWIREGAVWPR